MNKKDLLNLISLPKSKGGTNQIQESGFSKKFPQEYVELLKIRFPENFWFRQKLYHYLHDDYELKLGLCKKCGKRCDFKSIKLGYHMYCSNSCAQSDPKTISKSKQTRKERYGNENFSNREKAKQTCLEKYGVENPQQLKSVREKSLKTKHERYGETCEKIIEKTKQTKRERYGNENYNNLELAKKTNLEKYGAENVFASEYGKTKIKKTNIERYGFSHANKNKTIAKKISIARKNFTEIQKKQYIEQYHKTMLKKYGVLHNTHIYTDFDVSEFTNEQILNIREYINNKNKSYHDLYEKYINFGIQPKNISKTELDTYSFLISLFSEETVKCQYKCETYPYNCDFYIKSLDLFIELNAYWTHGGHPFDKDDENDKMLLDAWKNMNKPKYNDAVNTWTVRDIEKRNCAEKNHLNYLEIFSDDLEEIKKTILDYIGKL